jgi:hypothetical protein
MGDMHIQQLDNGERAAVRESRQTRMKQNAAVENYAEKIHDHLRKAPDGATREFLSRAVLGGGVAASRVGAALALLREAGRARFSIEPRQSGGWTERWVAM